ncbi:MAG: PAC2 family protein [Thaumarchaeota archaeon]|nr:PAC2 family protein [Nitrososphaerota archaeon]
MRETVFSTPRTARPVLVCGLPGSGYVGKLAADHLVELFGLKRVAEYRTRTFPPQLNVGADGVGVMPKGELFYGKGGKGAGVFVFTADAQPTTSEGEYELSDKVVGFVKKCGVKKVYALAAYITGSFSTASKVYGAATSEGMLKDLSAGGATLMKDGGISGMNGLLIGMASLRGLHGACLMGETSGYVVDAGASQAVLELLSKLTGIPIDTSKLKEKADETQKMISQLQSMSEQERETAPPPSRERPGYIG